MKKIKHIPFYMLFGILIILSSCQKEEIMTFDETRSAVNFVSKSVEYTFLVNPENEFLQEVEVRILGNTVDYDRAFEVEVIEATSTASSDLYEIYGGTVKAGEFTGTFSVKLFNAPILADTMLSIDLRFVESADFILGNIETSEFTIGWTDKIVVPSWSWIRHFFCATASTEAYRVLIASTGLVDFTFSDYRAIGPTGATALGTQFGDYIKEWNKNNPDNHLKHDDGTKAGEDIIPKYYTHSKYD